MINKSILMLNYKNNIKILMRFNNSNLKKKKKYRIKINWAKPLNNYLQIPNNASNIQVLENSYLN